MFERVNTDADAGVWHDIRASGTPMISAIETLAHYPIKPPWGRLAGIMKRCEKATYIRDLRDDSSYMRPLLICKTKYAEECLLPAKNS